MRYAIVGLSLLLAQPSFAASREEMQELVTLMRHHTMMPEGALRFKLHDEWGEIRVRYEKGPRGAYRLVLMSEEFKLDYEKTSKGSFEPHLSSVAYTVMVDEKADGTLDNIQTLVAPPDPSRLMITTRRGHQQWYDDMIKGLIRRLKHIVVPL